MANSTVVQTEKLVRLRNTQGRRIGGALQVVREHYLREDIPCYSPLCLADCGQWQDTKLNLLPSDVTHYIVPDCLVAREYLELLEITELTGIIFMHTVTHSVQHEGGRRLYRKLQKILQNPQKGAITFHNEFQKYAYCPRKPKEPLAEWQARSIYEACAWYGNHLAGQMPIIMLTQDPQVAERYKMKTMGVHVMQLDSYLATFWPQLTEAAELYQSLTASLQCAQAQGGEYENHLPAEVLEAGIKTGRYIQGQLNVNKHNAQNEAFVRPTGVSGKEATKDKDILIFGQIARNRAIHGDMVVVELLPRKQWRGRSNALKENKNEGADGERRADDDEEDSDSMMPTGHVVGVLQRRWRDVVASFEQTEEVEGGGQRKAGKVLVIPMDWRIPKIRITTSQAQALKDHRIIVRLDNWEVSSQYPNGHFVRSLGPAGQLETEIATILAEHSISTPPFSDAQLAELPSNTPANPWQMSKAEIKQRRDLRKSHLVFSIDPKGCEDVDDTLSVRKLSNGRLELGVHIADVTHFVGADSLTDHEARQRATTVYLADRRYDMLPEVLSADLCSLVSGVDRYAVSVIWELDEDFRVVNVWYGRTVIHSRYKLFYEIAQELHEGADQEYLIDNIPELQGLHLEEQEKRLEELRWAVDTLMHTARGIHAGRTRQGALELEGVEVQVQIDKSSDGKQDIQDLVPKQTLEIHETIAECMIFANHWVAKKISETYPNYSLLRHHPPPRQEDFGGLQNCASAKGFIVDTSSNGALAHSLNTCVNPHDPTVNKLLRSLATQAMSNAAYFSTGSLSQDKFFHYGLALPRYTHFTSPIRRYADVLVHRQLLAAVGGGESADKLPGNQSLQEMADHINIKHRTAQYAQKESVELFQSLFFKTKPENDPSRVVDGVIFQIRSNGILVFVPRYGLRGAVYLKDREGQVAYASPPEEGDGVQWVGGSISLSMHSVTVTTVLGDQTYRLMDHITVRVTVQESHAHASNLKLELLSNKPHTATMATDAKGQKAEIIKEVTKSAEDDKSSMLADLGPNFEKLKVEYGQTNHDKSLYSFLQTMSDEALMQEVLDY